MMFMAFLAAALAPTTDPVAAVSTCIAAVGPKSMDEAKLLADGWAEKSIDNVDKAPGGAAANRLFHKDGQGVIYVNVAGKGDYHCHWLISADVRTADAMNAALAKHFGGKMFPAGKGGALFSPADLRVIVMSSLKPTKGGAMYEVHTMAYEAKSGEKK